MTLRRQDAAYVGALIALVIAAVIGLITLHGDGTDGHPGAAATGSPDLSSGPSATRPPPPDKYTRVFDRIGDTTGPDLAGLAALVAGDSLRVRVSFATTVTNDVVVRLYIDADTDRTTGSIPFPCSAATLGVDFMVAIHAGHASLLASTANGCQTTFRTVPGLTLPVHVSAHAVAVRVPTSAVHPPRKPVLEMYAEAMHDSGGQIDSCPGRQNPPLSLRYRPGTSDGP